MKLKAILLGIVSYFLITTNTYAAPSSLEELRTRFNNWQTYYQSLTNSEQKKLLDSLKDYPLYPYAKYQYLQANLDTATAQQINEFVTQNSDFPFASTLTQNYLEQLTKQQKWDDIKTLNIDNSTASRCRYQYALFKQGKKSSALKPIKNIWLSADDLPSACDPIFNEWSKAGEKTANIILLRIELVLERNNIKLARHLTEQLPDNYKTLKKNLLALYNNPKTLPEFAKNIAPSSFSQKVVNLSFPRFASIDADKAKASIATIVTQQKLTKKDENSMFRAVASNYFKDSATDKQIEWRKQFIAKDGNAIQIEREIRQALKSNDIKDVAYWLAHLPEEDKQKDEWQYWQSIVLLDKKQEEEANQILNNLVKSRGFYSMFSAQKLKQLYHYDLKYAVIKDATSTSEESLILEQKYSNNAVMKRIGELRFWHMLPEATREWRNYLYSNTANKKYAQLARYAYYKGWAEHSIQATIAGKLWDNWLERFPVIYQDIFNASLSNKVIPLSYSLAIARQESALDATVQSPVGARGLMQLMPGTAKDSAKKIADLTYNSTEQLYDPEINIKIGTHYLDYVYQLFDDNRILASAAYNAGPNRVSRWLKESNGQLDAIAFIESIPFTETRNYVKSVLVYDYIYELMLNNQPSMVLHDNEVEYKY
ncbi:murein transglycosylase [Orbus sturtevantii]|uniref:murein transglycosylase n=1 Tax=Orbus sturtevantii TaxID=3074109 RepID=UPI00370D7182